MSTVFPVEFRVLADGSEEGLSHWFQAFTRDVSEGGLCLEFKTFGKASEEHLRRAGQRLLLTINPAFSAHPIRAIARVVWTRREAGLEHARYFIGVEYQSIEEEDRARLIAYARRSLWFPRLAFFLFVVIAGSAVGLSIRTWTLAMENRRLIADLRTSADARSEVASGLMALDDRRRSLEKDLETALAGNRSLEEKLQESAGEIGTLSAEQEILKKELAASQDRESMIRSQLSQIQKSRGELKKSLDQMDRTSIKGTDALLRQMVEWLQSHQNRRTGLLASYEGDGALEDVAFTYDQSLAAQVFLRSGQTKAAEEILSFFSDRAKRQGGAFCNAYDAPSGAPQEMTVHAGPNLWIGIAALQHANETRSGRFLPLATSIGEWALRMMDDEGGIPGGPGVTWYSTEHNLDAYAFFGMLHRMTRDDKYLKAMERSQEWIRRYAYSNREAMVSRGKGDATIATDTFAWSIAAIGPARLTAMEIDPAEILDFAEDHCRVIVDRGEKGKLTGFDFARSRNLGRGGVVSSEWTAQMIVSYKILARFYSQVGDRERAERYSGKAAFYLSELQKLLMTSPSRTGQGKGCLPYASADNVDTGHGWRTPAGSRTGSVAATAYGWFAWTGYNPFQLEEKNASVS